MIETICDFLQIHEEMVFRHVSIIIQNMLGIAPTAFDPVNMILGSSSTHEDF